MGAQTTSELTSDVLERTDFQGLGERRQGKIRDIYLQPDRIVLVTTDRHSSFDRIIALIPGKGEVLNRTSAFWFERTTDIVPNHVIAIPDPNVTVGKRCEPLRIEAVMRAHLAGVTSTSIWTQYKDGRRDFGAFTLPDGMRKNEPLPAPIFTPTTKEESHDRNVTPQEAVALGIISQDLIERIEDISRKLFARGRETAGARGFLLVDTKYEFGLDRDGNLLLIDEVHSPDSSRWWMADTYEARMRAGQEPDSFDKEFLRLWFVEHCDPYNDPVLPQAPADMVQELASRYVRFFEQLTGEAIVPHAGEAVAARIRRNLAAYEIPG